MQPFGSSLESYRSAFHKKRLTKSGVDSHLGLGQQFNSSLSSRFAASPLRAFAFLTTHPALRTAQRTAKPTENKKIRLKTSRK
jgi:hypothetical protein